MHSLFPIRGRVTIVAGDPFTEYTADLFQALWAVLRNLIEAVVNSCEKFKVVVSSCEISCY